MLEYFTVIFINDMSVVIILLLMRLALGSGFKLNAKRIGLIAAGFFLYDAVLEYVCVNETQEGLGVYLFMLVVIIAALPKKSLSAALYLVPAMLLYTSVDSLVELVARHADIAKYTVETVSGPIEVVVILADIIWIICLYSFEIYLEKRKIEFSISAGEAVFLNFFCLFFPFYQRVYDQLVQDGYSRKHRFLWIFFCISLNYAVLRSFWHKRKTRYYRDISEAYARYYKAEYEQFLNYKESQTEMDRFRHDINNHIIIMQELLSGGQYDRALAYMDRLLESKNINYFPVLTGNEITDILVKMKYQKMQDMQIALQVAGNFNVISHMEPMDICVIFSNALDNAIEACEKVEENRYIEIAAKEFSCYTMVCLKNPLPEEVRDKKAFSRTSKENKKQHGFGIGNIRMTLAKYQGELSYEQKENEMITRMVLHKP